MNLTVQESKFELPYVGDIIEYEESSRRKHPFYMVCKSEKDGFFIISLTGSKHSMKYYSSIEFLMRMQTGVKRIYRKSEWELKLSKLS
jgi:hypothetical protein